MKRIALLLAVALLWPLAAGAHPPPIKVRVEEADGSPTGRPTKIKLSGCTVSYSGSAATITCTPGPTNYAGSASPAGPATTALALAANGANCASGSAAGGVDASGAAESCVILPLSSFLTANATNATATLAATGLSVTLTAGHKYGFRAVLFLASDDGGDGFKFDLDGGTMTVTAFRAHVTVVDGAGGGMLAPSPANALTSIATDTAVAGVTNDTPALVDVVGAITVNAGGTFAFRFACGSASTATIFRGSHVLVWDIP